MMTESNGEKMTLNTLLDGFEVVIPIIQRDYAHGRTEEADIRNNFLEALYQAIIPDGKPAVLDYIYGSIDNLTKRFLPIDGQQRLTTLYLLYWYLSVKERDTKTYLQKFKYEVRDSATEFCEGLSKNTIALRDLPSNEIREAPWYHSIYDTDPTVLSMLNMLDAIHERFYEVENGCDTLENGAVSFWTLPLEGFGLTDDLFIKMNARGKRTSKFDVFKSKFEQHIDETDIDIEKREEWKDRIDNEWLDDYWNNELPSLSETHLLNHIVFIARAIRAMREGSYTDITNISEAEQRKDMEVLSEPDNFDFLIYTLNDMPNVAANDFAKNSFENVILEKSDATYPHRARLYSIFRYRYETSGQDDKKFERIMSNLISGQRRVQQNRKQFESNITAETFGQFLRSTNTLIHNAVKYGDVINALVQSDLRGYNFTYLSYEKEKACYFAPDGIVDEIKYREIVSIESIPDLSGLIHCFFFENKCWLPFKKVLMLLDKKCVNPTLLLRCLQSIAQTNLLAQQFYGQWKELALFTDPHGSHAEYRFDRFHKYFLGRNKSDIWGDYLLSSDSKQLIDVMRRLIKQLSVLPFVNIENELEELINQQLVNLNMNEEQYYFVKYREFYGDDSSDVCVCLRQHYKNWHYYYMRVYINREAGHRGHLDIGKHFNPYYRVLQNILLERQSSVKMLKQDDKVIWGKNTHQWVRLDNGYSMRLRYRNDPNKNGISHFWEINSEKAQREISDTAQTMLDNDELDCNGMDCIERASEFIIAM